MKLYIHLLLLGVITFQNCTIYVCQLYDEKEIYRRVRLPAVASFDGLEDYFLQMYDARLKSYKDAPDPTVMKSEGVKQLDLHPFNARYKAEMCKYILESDHFRVKQVKHADPRQWSVRKELKNQQEIFKELWKPSNKKAWRGGSPEGYKNEYENPFRTRSISTKRDKKEEKKEETKPDDKSKAPEAGKGKAPDAGQGKAPDAGQGKAPDAGKGKAPDAGQGKAPDAGQGKAPDAGQGKAPDAGKGKAPDAGQGKAPDAGGQGEAPEKKEEPKVFATDKVYVFSCVVRKPEGSFQLYYVSEDYDMSAASSKGPYARPISGRFIFVPNEQNKLVVHAVTQESTKSLTETRRIATEYVYLEKKLTHSTAGKPDEDPICRLNVGQRVRLCSAIFSMKELKHRYRFLNAPGSAQTDCQKHKISYRSGTIRRKVGGRTNFQEWMFACKPHVARAVGSMITGHEDLVPVTYYVSRGYVNDRVFLHRERGGRIYPEWFLYGTGVVDDVPKPEPPKPEPPKPEEKKEEKKVEKKPEPEPPKPEPRIEYYPDGIWSSWPYSGNRMLSDYPYDLDYPSASSSSCLPFFKLP